MGGGGGVVSKATSSAGLTAAFGPAGGLAGAGKDLLFPKVPGFDFGGIADLERRAREKEAEEKRKREELTKKLRENLTKEEEAQKKLIGVRGEREAAVERTLQERLGGIEALTEQEGIQTGEQAAASGLSRSTFAQRAQEGVTLREQQRKGQARGEAAAEISEIARTEQKLQEDIRKRRAQTELEIEFGDLQTLVRQKDFLTAQGAEQRFQAEFGQLQLESQRKQQMASTFGSFASSAATIFACWVAREIFGPDNIKWVACKHYILRDSPLWFTKLYLRHGERFSLVIRRHKWLGTILRPLFEYFAVRGIRNGNRS